MRSKQLSIEVKQNILRLKKKKKSIREIAELLGVAKSTVGYILRKKEFSGELGNSKRPGRPRKTTMMDDRRKLTLVKKNSFTTSTEVQNTLREVGVSVSKSTVKRRLHEINTKGSHLDANHSSIPKIDRPELNLPKNTLRSQPSSGKVFYGQMRQRSTCTRMMGRKKFGEERERHMIQGTPHPL